MLEEIRYNREKDYAEAAVRGQHMQLGFLQHSLMISRMHFMLEMACRNSGGKVLLEGWHQGAELRGPKVNVPESKSRRIEGGNIYVWEEQSKTKKLPVEPDAVFSLRFPARPTENQLSHFCYEADRGSMPMADMRTKFRAYRRFIKQQLPVEAFGVHPIRAVLMKPSANPARESSWSWCKSRWLWETESSQSFLVRDFSAFTAPAAETSDSRILAAYQDQPEIILDPLWALPDFTMHSLSDSENSIH